MKKLIFILITLTAFSVGAQELNITPPVFDPASPGAIGGTTPAAGTFTDLASTGNTDIGDADTDSLTITATIDADVDMGGNYFLQSQSVADLNTKQSGASYSFDGDNDKLTATDNAVMDDIFDGGGFAYAEIYPLSDGEGNVGRIFDKRDASALGWQMFTVSESGGNVAIRFFAGFDSTNGSWTTDVNIPLNAWTNVAVSYDADDVANNPTVYINGKPLTVGDGLTETGTPVGTRTTDDGNALTIGNRETGDYTFNGQIANAKIGNLALDNTDATDKAIINGGPIPYKYQGASQTERITDSNNTDFANASINDWVVNTNGNGTVTYDAGPGAVKTGLVTVGGTAGTYTTARLSTGDATTLENGKKYRWKADIYIPSANNNWTSIKLDAQAFDATPLEASANVAIEDAWQTVIYEFVITGTDVSGAYDIIGISSTTGDLFYIDNISITQIGLVAEYDSKNATPTVWYEPQNGLDATVSGATLVGAVDTLYVADELHVAGNVGIGTASPSSNLQILDSSGVATLKLHGQSTTTTPAHAGGGGVLQLKNTDSTPTDGNFTAIQNLDQDNEAENVILQFINVNHTNNEGAFAVSTRPSGGSMTEALRIDSSQDVTLTEQLIRSVAAGITATNPGDQGDNPLTKDINEISTVGTADDAVTLMSAVAGACQKIINNGANQLEIWPASGDDCGAGANTACTLSAGSNVEYCAYDDTNLEAF